MAVAPDLLAILVCPKTKGSLELVKLADASCKDLVEKYQEHFQDSAFTDKDLAILAYFNAPPQFREPFDETVAEMNDLVAEGVIAVEQAIATGEPERIEFTVNEVSRKLQSGIDRCSAIINGTATKLDQSAVDALFD